MKDARLSLPCLLLCLLAPIEAVLASRRYWFTEAALDAHMAVIHGLVWGGLALAALLALAPPARQALAAHLENLGRLSPRRHAAWLGAVFAGLFALFFFLKYCQYRGFQLPADSAGTANACYNVIRHGSFACPVFGVANHFAVHFIPLLALLAPALLVANSLLSLVVIQVLLTASMPLAAYLLVQRRTGSSLAGLSGLWLVFTSPYLFHIAGASVYPGMYLSLFFVWAMVGVELGIKPLAAASFLLMALSIEQACLAFLGLGVYLIARLGVREKRAWALGGAVCAAALAGLFLELKLKYSFPESARFRSWEMFRHLGPTPGEALRALLARPFETLGLVLWPPSKLKPLWDMLLSAGFLPLLEPLSLIPWLVNYAPGLLAAPGDVYHTIRMQYAGYFIGPLWWAAALGLIRAHAWLERRKLASWLAVLSLALGAVNLRHGPNVLLRDWMRSYFSEGPALTALIPPKARVWAAEYATAWVSSRSHLKALPYALDAGFLGAPFKPDFVLFDRDWLTLADAPFRDRVLTFLAREGYAKEAEFSALVLLKHPRAPLAEGGGEPPFELPAADRKAAAYAAFLRRNDAPGAVVKLWRGMAERGDEQAQFNLGTALYTGLGVAKDPEAARRWWTLAAAQGVLDAQNNLGMDYTVRGDWDSAIGWFRMAAEAGHAGAQFNLGVCYATGKGAPQDHEEAAAWFRKAAKAGNTDAQHNLEVYLAADPAKGRSRKRPAPGP